MPNLSNCQLKRIEKLCPQSIGQRFRRSILTRLQRRHLGTKIRDWCPARVNCRLPATIGTFLAIFFFVCSDQAHLSPLNLLYGVERVRKTDASTSCCWWHSHSTWIMTGTIPTSESFLCVDYYSGWGLRAFMYYNWLFFAGFKNSVNVK